MVDEFTLKISSGVEILISDKKLAWSEDRDRYENVNEPGNWYDMSSGISHIRHNRKVYCMDANFCLT